MENLNIKMESPLVVEGLLHAMEVQDTSCAIYTDGAVLTHKSRGVKPMVDFWSCGDLEDAVVCDKVIGKASAMFLVSGGAAYVHGQVMSQLALDFLVSNSIDCGYDQLVEKIKNREGNGLCPMESSVADVNDIDEGIENVINKMNELGIENENIR